jgi:glycosyltransferase involved in cell wall biosynthesis
VIAYLHQSPAVGAVECYVEHLLQGLDEDAVVIAPRGSELPGLRPFDQTLSAPAQLRHLVRELRAVRPRLAHVADVWPIAFLAARLARVPRVLVTHHTPELPRQDNLVGRVLWRAGWATHPEVIYTSESDRARDGRAGVVVPLGIDLKRFAVERRSHEGRVIGNVARLAEQKGQRTLIKAAPAILERFPDARFVIVGDGELRGELEVAAAGLPFELTGTREDVAELLAGFDVFAFPSRFEGLCLAVIEAQVAGVPVVATPVGGIVETVVPGETGVLVPVDDQAALADAVCALLADPELAGAMAGEARRRALARFSVDRMVQRTIALYR